MIEALTAAEATEVLRNAGLRITPETIRDGIQKKVFPFGDCVMAEDGKKVKWCYIYKALLDRRKNGERMSIEMSIVAAIIIIGTAKVAGWFMRFLSWLEGER